MIWTKVHFEESGDYMLFCSPFDETHPRYYRISNVLQQNNFYAVEVGYNKVPPGMRQCYKRNIFIIHYIISGKGFFCGRPFDKDCAYIILPDEQEDFTSSDEYPYEAYWIMFQGKDTMSILKSASLPTHNKVFKFNDNKKCAEIIHKALFDMKPKNELEEAYLMQSALYEIFSLHLRSSATLPASALAPEMQIKKFLDENFFRDININELTKKMHYSRTAMFKAFKNAYNETPLEYLTNLRITKSKELLTNRLNKLSISEVSQIVGFNDPLYFSRVFSKKTGLSPSEFRKRH